MLAPEETYWYFSGRSSNEAGFLAAALRAAVRHEQRQQLQLLLPPSERRGADERHGQRHGDDPVLEDLDHGRRFGPR